jgi:hypothetical protein
MTQTEKIVTLARRYCIDNIHYWTNYYAINKGKDLKYDYKIFPRYQTSEAILNDIETLVGKDFESVEQCFSELKVFGVTSQSPFTTGKLNELQIKSIKDARQKFKDYINQITVEQFGNVEPLPYKRRMLEEEANKVRENLLKYWGFDGSYWEPLNSSSPKPFYFFDKEKLSDEDFEKLKDIVLEKASFRIYEISETRKDYEIDKTEFEPNCYEIIYTGKEFDWIFYGSHEGTIAFGGDWLLADVDIRLSDKTEHKNSW